MAVSISSNSKYPGNKRFFTLSTIRQTFGHIVIIVMYVLSFCIYVQQSKDDFWKKVSMAVASQFALMLLKERTSNNKEDVLQRDTDDDRFNKLIEIFLKGKNSEHFGTQFQTQVVQAYEKHVSKQSKVAHVNARGSKKVSLTQQSASNIQSLYTFVTNWLFKQGGSETTYHALTTMLLLVCCESEGGNLEHLRAAGNEEGCETYLRSLVTKLELQGVINLKLISNSFSVMKVFQQFCVLFILLDTSTYFTELQMRTLSDPTLQVYGIDYITSGFVRVMRCMKYFVTQDKSDPETHFYNVILSNKDEPVSIMRKLAECYDAAVLQGLNLPLPACHSAMKEVCVGVKYGTCGAPAEVEDWVVVLPHTRIPEGVLQIASTGYVTQVHGDTGKCNVHLDVPAVLDKEEVQDCLGVDFAQLDVLFHPDLPDKQLHKYCTHLVKPKGKEKDFFSRNKAVIFF
jgi:hypothetical protein